MRGINGNNRLARLEDAARHRVADHERKARQDEAALLRMNLRTKREYAALTPLLRAAVAGAEAPYQALLGSRAWARTCEAVEIAEGRPTTGLAAPIRCSYGLSLSFGPTITLHRKLQVMAPRTVAMKVEGSLTPIAQWWETGRSIPQEPGSPVISLYTRVSACPTILEMCDLLRTGRLLDVIQSGYLRALGVSGLRGVVRRLFRDVGRSA